ncbi:MAG: M56 family metallopeptidase [Nannocystaceae bacterium]
MTTPLDALGWGVLHSLWGAAGLAAVIALALRRVPTTRPRRRHAIAAAGLLFAPVLASAAALVTVVGPGAASTAIEAGAVAVASTTGLDAAPRIPVGGVLPALAIVWLIGVGVGGLRLTIAARQLAALRRRARPLAIDDAAELLRRAGADVDRRGAPEVALATSDEVGVPTVIGWRRPLCVFPAALRRALGDEALAALLAHELAHVRRRDVAWNWALALAELALFFHPCATWIAAQVRCERECACDQAAIRGGEDLALYVHALADLASQRARPTPALSALGGSLMPRVRRLIDPLANHHRMSLRTCLAFVALTGIGGALVAACDDAPSEPLADARAAELPGHPPKVVFVDKDGVATNVPAEALAGWHAGEGEGEGHPPKVVFVDKEGVVTNVPAEALAGWQAKGGDAP